MVLLQGIVIKFNANQRYATTAVTTTVLREIASKAGVPLQVRKGTYLASVIKLDKKRVQEWVLWFDG